MWTQKLDFPGTARIGAVAFVINGKAYIGTGNDLSGTGFKQDFYEYDPTSNTWAAKANFPQDLNSGAGITSGAAFAIGNFGYVGLGNTGLNNTQAFYRYDPATNSWQTKATFPGSGRTGAIGFANNGKGYFGFGFLTLSPTLKDMWEYDPVADSWTSKTDFSGTGRGGSAAAVVNGNAIIFAGTENATGNFGADVRTNAVTQYSTWDNQWSTQLAIPASIRTGAMAFAIGKVAYVFGGYNYSSGNIYLSDLYAFTPPSAFLPAPPSSAATTEVSESMIRLTWQDNSDNETGFIVEYAIGNSQTYAAITSYSATPNVTLYTHTGLTINTQYTYRVKTVNAYGSSLFSNTSSSVTTLIAPSNLVSQTLSTSSISLQWTDNSSAETGYEIYRSASNNTGYSLINTTSANTVTYTDTGLNPGTTYYYKVRAISAASLVSAYGNEVNSTTNLNPPAAPSNLSVQSFTSSQVVLKWADNSDNETKFEIYRSTPTNSMYSLLQTASANTTTFTDTGLSSSKTYFYKIKAINAGGSSSYSAEISQTTLPDPPAPPSNLLAKWDSNSQLTLSWKDNSTSETGFEIYRSVGDNINYVLVQTTSVNTTNYTDQGVTAGTIYYYKARAVNQGGNSLFSPEISTVITGFEDSFLTDFVIYPNPANKEFVVDNKTAHDLKFCIYNSLGELILEDEVYADNKRTVNCKTWNTGMYIISMPVLKSSHKIIKD